MRIAAALLALPCALAALSCEGPNLDACVDFAVEALPDVAQHIRDSVENLQHTQTSYCGGVQGSAQAACRLWLELAELALVAGLSLVRDCPAAACPSLEYRGAVWVRWSTMVQAVSGNTPLAPYLTSSEDLGQAVALLQEDTDEEQAWLRLDAVSRLISQHVFRFVWMESHFLWSLQFWQTAALRAPPTWHMHPEIYGQRWDVASALLTPLPAPHAVAEVGVFRGYFGASVLAAAPDVTLIGVDPYLGNDGTFPPELAHLPPNEVHAEALARLAPFIEADRAVLLRARSTDPEVLASIPDASLALVFIDGCHDLPCVVEDLAAWVGKVRPGGVVMGHDYGPVWPGVAVALNFLRAGKDLHLGMDLTWWWVKAIGDDEDLPALVKAHAQGLLG